MLLHLSTLALAGVVCAINGSITDYAPLVNQPCPDFATNPLLRVFTPDNQSLHTREESYVNTRLITVIPNEWKNWISDGSAIRYNLSVLNSSTFPKIGIAINGGGYRAAQYGAGVLSALDAWNQSGKAAGTGGLLRFTSCLSGLSGGSWLTRSLYMNDFPTVTDLMTPVEFGSWDPQLSAMVNITYTGTHLTNGQPANDTACTTFFDQVGSIMGTSASIFIEYLDSVHNTIQGLDGNSSEVLLFLLNQLESWFPSRAEIVADWPNPFFNLDAKQDFQERNSTWLELIDGGLNHEEIPLGQQFVRTRGLDVVVAVDGSSDDDNNFPNGTSMLSTASRITTLLQSSHQSFPPLPGNTTEFITTGVNMRPTFFGCFPTRNPPEYPMVIYLPNSPPLNGDNPVTNSPTLQLNYTPNHTEFFLDQVHANAIGGFVPNSDSPDPNFGKCLQCAAVDRARYKVNPPLARSSFCTQCFQQYCFDPNNLTNSSELPNRKLKFVNPG